MNFNDCVLPGALKLFAMCHVKKDVSLLKQLSIPDESTSYLVHLSLLSLKCCLMGLIMGSIKHTTFIKKLLSQPVLKETIHDHFPNGLSPLHLAHQF